MSEQDRDDAPLGFERVEMNCECGGKVVVWTGDPYYPDYAQCPECDEIIERTILDQ